MTEASRYQIWYRRPPARSRTYLSQSTSPLSKVQPYLSSQDERKALHAVSACLDLSVPTYYAQLLLL
ncbi:hypothetical protein [Marinicrinis lubricantis]|uniref:hypothetical protein n=1 Tax=Marinicrinis lubricantis TaxID=2086470 RepID=UPI0039EFE3A2